MLPRPRTPPLEQAREQLVLEALHIKLEEGWSVGVARRLFDERAEINRWHGQVAVWLQS